MGIFPRGNHHQFTDGTPAPTPPPWSHPPPETSHSAPPCPRSRPCATTSTPWTPPYALAVCPGRQQLPPRPTLAPTSNATTTSYRFASTSLSTFQSHIFHALPAAPSLSLHTPGAGLPPRPLSLRPTPRTRLPSGDRGHLIR